MGKKDELIADLEESLKFKQARIFELVEENLSLRAALNYLKPVKTKKLRRKYSFGICLDLYPLSDWTRFKLNKWNPGKYWQLCVGPIRIEFYEI